MTKVSIIILTKNEESKIYDTLKSVFDQRADFKYDVVVIDSGSKDKTKEIIKGYPAKLVEIKPQDFGHGKTRNLGVSLTESEYVVFLNGDATPQDSKWLKSLIDSFSRHDNLAATYSRIYPRKDCNPLRAREIKEDSYMFGQLIKEIDDVNVYESMDAERKRKLIAFHTISCAIRRDVLQSIPFEDVEFGEDLIWSKGVLETGYKIAFEPDSKVVHSHDFYSSFRKTAKKYFDDSMLNQKIIRRWGTLALIKLWVILVLVSVKDILYISSLQKDLLYKTNWIIRTPLIRIAEYLGTLAGAFPTIFGRFENQLSLVAEINRK